MAFSTLDPNTALIVIDLQKGIAALAAGLGGALVVANAARLAAGFRARNLPVVLVNVVPRGAHRTERTFGGGEMPPDWMELVPELNVQPTDHCITKPSWGAFTGTGLEDWLKTRGITQVVMAGISTSIGVETTARQAFEAGFNVGFALDATVDFSPEAQANSTARIFPRLGETGTTDDVLRLLAPATASNSGPGNP
jgi:nicotinamidase-related amidase